MGMQSVSQSINHFVSLSMHIHHIYRIEGLENSACLFALESYLFNLMYLFYLLGMQAKYQSFSEYILYLDWYILILVWQGSIPAMLF